MVLYCNDAELSNYPGLKAIYIIELAACIIIELLFLFLTGRLAIKEHQAISNHILIIHLVLYTALLFSILLFLSPFICPTKELGDYLSHFDHILYNIYVLILAHHICTVLQVLGKTLPRVKLGLIAMIFVILVGSHLSYFLSGFQIRLYGYIFYCVCVIAVFFLYGLSLWHMKTIYKSEIKKTLKILILYPVIANTVNIFPTIIHMILGLQGSNIAVFDHYLEAIFRFFIVIPQAVVFICIMASEVIPEDPVQLKVIKHTKESYLRRDQTVSGRDTLSA